MNPIVSQNEVQPQAPSWNRPQQPAQTLTWKQNAVPSLPSYQPSTPARNQSLPLQSSPPGYQPSVPSLNQPLPPAQQPMNQPLDLQHLQANQQRFASPPGIPSTQPLPQNPPQQVLPPSIPFETIQQAQQSRPVWTPPQQPSSQPSVQVQIVWQQNPNLQPPSMESKPSSGFLVEQPLNVPPSPPKEYAGKIVLELQDGAKVYRLFDSYNFLFGSYTNFLRHFNGYEP